MFRVASNDVLVAIILRPGDVTLMVVPDQHFPVFPSPHHTMRDDFAAGFEPRPGIGAPIDISAGIDRIGQQTMNAMVTRRPPLHSVPLPTGDGNRQVDALLPQPEDELAHAADLGEFAED
jgi:hypothetical protein